MGDAYEIAKSLYQQIELMKPLLRYDHQKWEAQYKELQIQQQQHWSTAIDPEPFHELLRKMQELNKL